MPEKIGSPSGTQLELLVRRAAKRGVTLKAVARAAGRSHPSVVSAFQREQYRPLLPATRARYERAIEDAIAEKKSIAKRAAGWLRRREAEGRMKPRTNEEMGTV